MLLVSTLLRLSLNVASTRVVLLEGHTGPDAAGKVIEAFGHFLVGGNYAVGIVVFVILTIINFMVITKGAGRIAEVGARFTLDAMPGKQMAIDADLNAGLINEEEARKRRAEVAQEADFYGSMDGASKFVRGDAIAGILIMVINIVGGLIVGMVSTAWTSATAVKNYTLLTIGDGLVAQIPSLIISTAAGVIVSRVASERGHRQPADRPAVRQPARADITGCIIGRHGPDPGHAALRVPAARRRSDPAAARIDEQARRRRKSSDGARRRRAGRRRRRVENTESKLGRRDAVDTLGPRSRLSADSAGRQERRTANCSSGSRASARSSRRKSASCRRSMHIRDNLELRPYGYRITLKGVEVGVGEAYPGQWLAINPGQVSAALPGHADAATRRSACRRSGSTRTCANRRRCMATRWSMRARWSRRI